MRASSLSEADRVYDCSDEVLITDRVVSQPEFDQFCIELTRFARSLGEYAEDDLWRSFLGKLRRYRFDLCASLLPFNHPVIYSGETMQALRRDLRRCEMGFPDFAAPARALVEQAAVVAQLEAEPLIDILTTLDIAGELAQTALLLKETRLISPVEEELRPYVAPGQIEVINASRLRGGRCYQQVIVVGPSYWFRDHVFSAPRASTIDIVRYGWVRDRSGIEPVFAGSIGARTVSWSSIRSAFAESGGNEATDADRSLAEELHPRVDADQVVERALRGSRENGNPADRVDARLVLLDGDEAVFLDASEGVTTYVIDLEADPESRVRRVGLEGIEPDMFVILRKYGSGDYIVTEADRIMGQETARYREVQSLWKSRLRKAVMESSLSNVCTRLRGLGSGIANEGNVRNWMSERNIRTYFYEDFAAIMRLVGFEDRSMEFWAMMGRIDSAHRRAAFRISKLLLEQVTNCDLHELERLGRMDFELPSAVGGVLTAYRVEDVSSEMAQVSRTRINRTFPVGDSLWPG